MYLVVQSPPTHYTLVRVKVSLVQTKMTLKVTGGYGTHIFRHSAYKACEVVNLTRRPPSHPGKSWYS